MALPIEDRPPRPRTPNALTRFVRDLDDLPAAEGQLTPEAYALLDAIAASESAGKWNVIYGGSTFDDFSRHPRKYVTIKSGPNKGDVSSAAGKFQILASTYDRVAPKLGITDFTPESQQRIAWFLAQEAYGKGLQEALERGEVASVAPRLRKVWTSLPGGIEQGTNSARFTKAYEGALGHPVPALGLTSEVNPASMNALTRFKRGLDPMAPQPRPRVEREIAKNNQAPILRQLPRINGPEKATIRSAALESALRRLTEAKKAIPAGGNMRGPGTPQAAPVARPAVQPKPVPSVVAQPARKSTPAPAITTPKLAAPHSGLTPAQRTAMSALPPKKSGVTRIQETRIGDTVLKPSEVTIPPGVRPASLPPAGKGPPSVIGNALRRGGVTPQDPRVLAPTTKPVIQPTIQPTTQPRQPVHITVPGAPRPRGPTPAQIETVRLEELRRKAAKQAAREAQGKAIAEANRRSPHPTYTITGADNAFQPKSVQESVRWQTGY